MLVCDIVAVKYDTQMAVVVKPFSSHFFFFVSLRESYFPHTVWFQASSASSRVGVAAARRLTIAETVLLTVQA